MYTYRAFWKRNFNILGGLVMKVILTVGISNSGKTTWAEQQADVLVICRDDIRAKHHTKSGDINDYKFSKAKEEAVTLTQFKQASWAILNGKDIIVADTNLNPKTRKKWHDWASDNGVVFEIKSFPCEPHVAKARNLKRHHTIPPSAIDRQYLQWREFDGTCSAPYRGTPGKPHAVIFDVDGTLADMTGIRNPFEWDKVRQDMPRENVINLARSLYKNGYKIIVMSGRDGCSRGDTLMWLEDHIDGKYHKLFMRTSGDSRPDAVIKEELFWKDVADNYDVQFVVDDRNQMVDRWRAMGLECWQVQAGDF